MENVYGVHNIEFHLQWIILYSEKKIINRTENHVRLTGIVESGMIILGAQVKRLNCGFISCVVEIGLLTRGSTSAWVTFMGTGKEAEIKCQSETVFKRVYRLIRKEIPKQKLNRSC